VTSPPRPEQPGPADQLGGAGVSLPPGYVQSLIRTWVPVAIGSLIAWVALHWHIVVDPGASTTAGAIVTALCIAAYYALCRLVERRWPRLGAFLLSIGLVQAKPVYAQPTDVVRVIDTRTGEVRRVDPPRT
jgi:hypothetical protein